MNFISAKSLALLVSYFDFSENLYEDISLYFKYLSDLHNLSVVEIESRDGTTETFFESAVLAYLVEEFTSGRLSIKKAPLHTAEEPDLTSGAGG